MPSPQTATSNPTLTASSTDIEGLSAAGFIRIEDAQADLSQLARTVVTVCGRGSDSIALALCLRDSGIAVQVALSAKDSASATALEEGLQLADTQKLPALADDHVILTTGLHQARLVQAWDPAVVQKSLVVSTLPQLGGTQADHLAKVDAYLVPQAPPSLIRRRFCDGGGVSAVLALTEAAPNSPAAAKVIALARALGLTRAGLLLTSAQVVQNSWQVAWATVGLAGQGGLVGASVALQKQLQVPASVAMLTTMTALRQAADVFSSTASLPAATQQTCAWGNSDQLRQQVAKWWQDQPLNDSGKRS